MAKTLTPLDCHALINLMVQQATGQANITATDTSSFISAGETILSTGMENVYNAINMVLGRTIIAARPYSAKLAIMDAVDTGVYTSRIRKISYYSRQALPDGWHNTNLYTNLADGFTNGQNESGGTPQSTKSMWEQHQAMPLEMNFAGQNVWQKCITMYENQVKTAFRSEADFAAFVSGYLTEHQNDIESEKEAWRRAALLNKIGALYDAPATENSVINLTAAYNAEFGTSYSSQDLRTTYLKDFLAYFVSVVKLESKFMAERSVDRHWAVPKTVGADTYNILRHTPYADQRLYLYSPLFTSAESLVLPQIFNDELLRIDKQYEEITYWQSQQARASVSVTPAVTNRSTGVQEAGTPVALDYVVGLLVDKDALMTNFQMESVNTTPLEARKGYRNTWLSMMKGAINDPTENGVLFIMAD